MISKIKNKIAKMSTKDWINTSLWLLAFILLITFVILAATIEQTSTGSKHVDANQAYYTTGKTAPKNVFITNDDAGKAVNATTFSAVTPAEVTAFKSGGGQIAPGLSLFKGSIPAYESLKTVKSETYANALAGSGIAFAIALISALIFTVKVAYDKKRGAK